MIMFTYMTNQPMHNEHYAQSNIILHQHVSTTTMTIIRVSYSKNAIYIQ